MDAFSVGGNGRIVGGRKVIYSVYQYTNIRCDQVKWYTNTHCILIHRYTVCLIY